MNILIIDYEESVRRSLSFVLQILGCTAVEAASPEAAEDICASEAAASLDLIVVDDQVSSTRVPELVGTARDHGFVGKVLVLSPYLSPRKKREYHRLGVAGVLSSAFEVADLRHWLACLPDGYATKRETQYFPAEARFGKTVECWGPRGNDRAEILCD
jgi:CheY-like chemotaxis protein